MRLAVAPALVQQSERRRPEPYPPHAIVDLFHAHDLARQRRADAAARLSLTSRAFPVSGEWALRLFLRYSCEARSAWSRSSLMSSMFSIPTETRI